MPVPPKHKATKGKADAKPPSNGNGARDAASNNDQEEAADAQWDAAHFREFLKYNVPVPKRSVLAAPAVLCCNDLSRVVLGSKEHKLVSLTAMHTGRPSLTLS